MEDVKITSSNYDIKLLCPICGGEFTHLTNVEVYNAREDEIRTSVILTFTCEDGHTFKIDVHQHEGNTFLRKVD